jgi:predicted permease
MSWIDGLREQLSNLFVARDHELREEIDYHIELETQRNVAAGADPRIARARALARFGDRRQITEATRQARGGRFLEGGMQDLKWAVRSLRKSPGFTLLALFTLTLGIGATTAAFAVLDSVLLNPLAYPGSDRLVVIDEVDHDHEPRVPSYPNFDDWRKQARSFERVGSIQNQFMRITPPSGDAVRITAMGVSRNFFEMLRVKPIVGRTFTDDENRLGGPKVMMVSYEFWKDHLNGNPVLGTVRRGSDAYRVVGVMPPGFEFMAKYDAFFPHEQGPGTIRSAHYLTVVARLADGVTLTSAQAEMTGLSKRLFASFGKETQAEDAKVTPLRERYVGGYRTVLNLVFGAAAMVLLVACTNMVSAQLARGLARGREIAVRAALGAARGRLVRQLLVESFVLVVVGTALGAALAAGIIVAVRNVGKGLLPRLGELTISTSVLTFIAGTAALVTVLIGVYPALRVVRRDVADSLRGSRTGNSTVRTRVWRGLIALEVAMAVVLVCASTMLVRTLHNILTTDVGFDLHGIVTAALSSGDSNGARLDEIRTDLAGLPGVQAVAYTNQLPMNWGSWSAPIIRPTDPTDHDWPALAGFRVVSSNYFDVLRLPILRGRALNEEDRAEAPSVAVITPGIAQKLWPGENPIGKILRANMDTTSWLTVVGVASEARNWTMTPGSQNEVYVPRAQHVGWLGDPIALIRTRGSSTAMVGEVTKTLHVAARDIPARVGLLEDRVSTTAASRRFAMLALIAFGGIALLLAAVGIYGVLAYSVTSRQFEIGVRMALGATGESILRATLGSAATMTATGVVIGAVSALIATRFLKSLLYGVTQYEPTAYALGALLLLVVAMLGAYVPARRASRVDPTRAIRGDS